MKKNLWKKWDFLVLETVGIKIHGLISRFLSSHFWTVVLCDDFWVISMRWMSQKHQHLLRGPYCSSYPYSWLVYVAGWVDNPGFLQRKCGPAFDQNSQSKGCWFASHYLIYLLCACLWPSLFNVFIVINLHIYVSVCTYLSSCIFRWHE